MTLSSYRNVGDEIEARRGADSNWERATINRVDKDDDSLPYGVYFTSDREFNWVPDYHVRALSAEPPALQYRFRTGSRWGDWAPLTLGATQAFTTSLNNAFQVRVKPGLTDAEVVAKMRQRGSLLTLTEVRAILGGTY